MGEVERPGKQFHERQRSLTKHDIEDIINALEASAGKPHLCRFERVTEEDFYASVEFFKSFNAGLNSGKSVAAKTILVLLITFLCGVLGAGIFKKL